METVSITYKWISVIMPLYFPAVPILNPSLFLSLFFFSSLLLSFDLLFKICMVLRNLESIFLHLLEGTQHFSRLGSRLKSSQLRLVSNFRCDTVFYDVTMFAREGLGQQLYL